MRAFMPKILSDGPTEGKRLKCKTFKVFRPRSGTKMTSG